MSYLPQAVRGILTDTDGPQDFQRALDSDLARIRGELDACSYPKSFIAASQKRALRPTKRRDALGQHHTAIPYVPDISEALARVLRKYNVQVAHVPSRKLRHELVKLKDKLRKERFPGVVHKIPCADCNYVWIGESGNFKRGLKEHMRDVKKKKSFASSTERESCRKCGAVMRLCFSSAHGRVGPPATLG